MIMSLIENEVMCNSSADECGTSVVQSLLLIQALNLQLKVQQVVFSFKINKQTKKNNV